MKKLNKLQINPEKVIKIEELISLRGGYDYWQCQLYFNEEFLSNIQWPGATPPIAAFDCTEWHANSDLFGPGHWCECGC
jgi:hypothetical protein